MGDIDETIGSVVNTWEASYQRSWDHLQEDAQGSLLSAIQSLQRRATQHYRQRRSAYWNTQASHLRLRRGILRHAYCILDQSSAMLERDESGQHSVRDRIGRRWVMSGVKEFLDKTPMGQFGLIVTRQGKAHLSSPLSGHLLDHLKAIRNLPDPSGEASLQNALLLALQLFEQGTASTRGATRDLLIIWSSLTTCDPSDIRQTIAILRESKIRCSIIGMTADMAILKHLAESTQGCYQVALNEAHGLESVLAWVPPAPLLSSMAQKGEWFQCWFPKQIRFKDKAMSPWCACHSQPLSQGQGYLCSQCHAVVCTVPSTCPLCQCSLVSSPHLARSYHALYPMPQFQIANATAISTQCAACQCAKENSADIFYQCPNNKCQQIYCETCHVFIHETLHYCPGCVDESN